MSEAERVKQEGNVYPYEFAHYFLPEERKGRRFGLSVSDIGVFCNKVYGILSGGTVDYARLSNVFCEFLDCLDFPFPIETIESVNQLLEAQGKPRIPLEALRDFYTTKASQEIRREIVAACNASNADGIKRGLEMLEELKKAWGNSLEESSGRVVEITKRYDVAIDSRWHAQGFGAAEVTAYAEALKTLAERFCVEIDKISTYDIGSGPGRLVEQLEGLFKGEASIFPSQHLIGFMERYYAIDINHHNVQETRRRLRRVIGALESTIREVLRRIAGGGDDCDNRVIVSTFYGPHLNMKPGTTHLAFSMMRTSLHNLTERSTKTFLSRAAEALHPGNSHRPGGMLLMDMVDLPPAGFSEEAQANLDDLSHFYWQLILAYRRKYQKYMPEGIDLGCMPRFPIYDNTTGRGFYWRENPTVDYLRYVIEKHDVDLEVVASERILPTFSESVETITEWGLKWMHDNELLGHIQKEIKRRLEAGKVNQALNQGVSEEVLLESLLKRVAYRWVAEFPALFVTLQRPRK